MLYACARILHPLPPPRGLSRKGYAVNCQMTKVSKATNDDCFSFLRAPNLMSLEPANSAAACGSCAITPANITTCRGIISGLSYFRAVDRPRVGYGMRVSVVVGVVAAYLDRTLVIELL